jgi:hypothetical protein
MNGTSIDGLLSRLEQVKQTSPGKWRAKCPIHQGDSSSNRSLSIREAETGAVLMHCFAGCEINDIVREVQLQMSDLFPKDEYIQHARYARNPRGKDLRNIIDGCRFVAYIVETGAEKMLNQEQLTEDDLLILKGASRDLREMLDV